MSEQGAGKRTATAVQTVLVVDDHRTFADLLALALNGLEDVECIGEAHDADTARLLTEELSPDIVVMDVELGDADGIALSAELVQQYQHLRVLVLTAHATRAMITRAADAGVCALLPKDGDLASVLRALRWSRRDSFVVDPTLLQTLVSAPPAPSSRTQLSERETAVLALMAEGRDARRAASQLGISIHTFRGHVRNVLAKLDAHSQLEAVAVAKREGLLD